MDPNASYAFLRSRAGAPALPIDVTLDFEPVEKRGRVAMHYWPQRRETAGPPEHLVYFILGNPGVLDFYTPFLNLLHAQLPHTHALLCTSHVGGDYRLAGTATPADLLANVETKVECAQGLQGTLSAWAAESGAARPRLSLMGHSIGAWISVEVMKRVDGLHAAYMLFPTLGWIANSYNGWKLWPIFHRPVRQLLPLLARVLGPVAPYLPFVPLPPPALKFIQSPETIANVLFLARSEMLLVRRPELQWYNTQRERPRGRGVYGVWSAGNLDGWVGEDGPLVRECIGQERWRQLEGVPHAFCMKEKDYTQVADLVTHWITMDKPNGTMDKPHSTI